MTDYFGQKQSDIFFLSVLFCLSVIVRVSALFFYFQYNPCMTMYDAGHYHSLAQSLSKGLGFVGTDGSSYFYRLPGYPIFLAGCYLLFGERPIFTLTVQCIFASFIPVLIFFISRELCQDQKSVAIFSSIVSCFHVGYVIYANLLMAETLFLIFFLLFLLSLQQKDFFVSGLFLGFGSLIRPVGHFVILASIIYIFFDYYSSCKHFVKNSSGLFFGWISVVLCWIIRNHLLTGMIFLHTLSGPHFINHSAVRIIQKEHNISYEQAKKIVYQQVDRAIYSDKKFLGRDLNQAEESKIMEKIAFDIMKQYPLKSVLYCLLNIFKTTFSLYSSELLVIEQKGALPDYSSERGLKSIFLRFIFPKVKNSYISFFIHYELFFWFLILFGFFMFCLGSIFFKQWLRVLKKEALYICLMIALSSACGFARFRLPVEHFFIIFASIFWVNCFISLKKSFYFFKDIKCFFVF